MVSRASKWTADDGEEFNSLKEAQAHDRDLDLAATVIAAGEGTDDESAVDERVTIPEVIAMRIVDQLRNKYHITVRRNTEATGK